MTSRAQVFIELGTETVEVGTAHFTYRRRTSCAFRYRDDYLSRQGALAIDPALPLDGASHHTAGLPGAFEDCSPDRWGRNLIAKRLRALALDQGRTRPTVSDVDLLLGVSDETRQGALRFRRHPDGPFEHPEPTVPKLVELPRLLNAADRVSRDDDDFAAIKMLLEAGTGSLGGARPKASVRDGDRLLIAKFPHQDDDWNVMAWERTVLQLARAAGIETPQNRLVDVGGRPVLLLERFDRAAGGRRIPYLSAMTLVGGRDGDQHDYVDVAEALSGVGAAPKQDLLELFRRLAFFIAVRNTDDHLRNHGFLAGNAGWRLSPVFDVNPNPDTEAHRATSIGGAFQLGNEAEALKAYAVDFGVSGSAARTVVTEILDATATWERYAAENGASVSERVLFKTTFDRGRAALADGFH